MISALSLHRQIAPRRERRGRPGSCLLLFELLPRQAELTDGGADGSKFQVASTPVGNHRRTLRRGIEPFPVGAPAAAGQFRTAERHELG